MTLEIQYQESYSRGQLLLRTFFGLIYIVLPHLFVLMFLGIWSAILGFISWWAIMFTGRYPQSFYEFQVGLMRWQLRVNARLFDVSDGYPPFSLNGDDPYVTFEVEYPEQISRGLTLVRTFFGWLYVGLPHGFILYFLAIGVIVVNFINFWVVLFTGKMPDTFHKFIVGYLRWSTRVSLYLSNMTDTYPPFNLDPDKDDTIAGAAQEDN